MDMTLFAAIQERLAEPNGVVQVTTCTRSTLYRSKHAALFVAPTAEQEQATGVYVRRGKQRDYIDSRFVSIRFGRSLEGGR